MEIYIGSTHDEIQREQEHKSNWNNENYPGYNRKVYVFIRDNGGWDNWIYKVIQEFPCENELQLRIRERDHYDLLNPALNTNRPYITEEERKENIAKLNAKRYKDNRDEILKHHAKYDKEHREERKEKSKKNYKDNREEILKRNKQKHNCECGGKYTHGDKSKHCNTNMHKNFLKNQEI